MMFFQKFKSKQLNGHLGLVNKTTKFQEFDKYATFKLRIVQGFYPGPVLLQFLIDLEKMHKDC